MSISMAFRQVQRRYSRFISDASTHYCRNSKFGAPTMISRTHLLTFPCKQICENSPAAWQKRFFLKNREFDEGRWFASPVGAGLAIILFSAVAVIGVWSGKWVTVPITGRRRFILFYRILDHHDMPDLGDPVSRLHPDYIKARRIYEDILELAFPMEVEVRAALEKENWWSRSFPRHEREKEECDIIVVDSPYADAITSGRFGKMYATTTIIHQYGCNEMLATHIAQLFGKDLARHSEEIVSNMISTVSVIGTSLYLFSQSTFIRSKLVLVEKFMRLRFFPGFSFVGSVVLLSYLVVMKYSREMVMESDHIGLMLASSAGYNPHLGLLFPCTGFRPGLPQIFLPTPLEQTRVSHLNRNKVLNKAISRWKKSSRKHT